MVSRLSYTHLFSLGLGFVQSFDGTIPIRLGHCTGMRSSLDRVAFFLAGLLVTGLTSFVRCQVVSGASASAMS